ncbi:peptidoglycan editing factor PgeF [Vibrio profundi]|uniref:peptidoglycan editing factor PgeF n=1 Tax=Vibrio profundi TaxID=1774960 RepID=UPI003735C99A
MTMIIPRWNAPKNVKAFASTRVGGFSKNEYLGLNLGTHVGDDLATVQKNREWLQRDSMMPSAPTWLNQTHSTTVIEVNSISSEVLDADGAFTKRAGIVCSAMTADCLPVLLTNTQGTQVAAVHAGWRGLADGIVENAVQMFDGEVIAWLGPAIGSGAFEVGEDVLNAFVSFDGNAIHAFEQKTQPSKWLANMSQLAMQRLDKLGVSKVTDSNLCTFSDPSKFYSYRRDGVTGRQASFIWME